MRRARPRDSRSPAGYRRWLPAANGKKYHLANTAPDRGNMPGHFPALCGSRTVTEALDGGKTRRRKCKTCAKMAKVR